MVAGGSVRARWFPGEGVCLARFAAAERVARLGRIGLWGEPEYAIRSSNDLSLGDRNGLYALVEGRVVTVGHGTRMIFLDFGRNFRRDFTVMVAPEVTDLLKAEGRDPDAFAGRRVIVRGTIEESGGPAIRLNDPAEIEWIGDGPEDAGAQH
jgi:micrococcal nuclease